MTPHVFAVRTDYFTDVVGKKLWMPGRFMFRWRSSAKGGAYALDMGISAAQNGFCGRIREEKSATRIGDSKAVG